MASKSGRSYKSPARQRQADETRCRIASAARSLLLTRGYAGMTVDAIARQAGVSGPTVYAVFGSKTGILMELLDRATFGPVHYDLVRHALSESDPSARLRVVAQIARNIHDSASTMLDTLRGAGVVAPELSKLENGRECLRYDAQEPIIAYLIEIGRLKRGLDATTARDILWSLTARELYRMLVCERGWSSEKYETWLADTLIAALLSEEPADP